MQLSYAELVEEHSENIQGQPRFYEINGGLSLMLGSPTIQNV